MNVTLYGTGYVGLITGACLAELGHNILCIDVDANKIAALENGKIPIYEPGLEELIEKNIALKRLAFSTDAEQGVKFGLLQFICVNTPQDSQGAADISNVLAVAKTIAKYLFEYRLIVNKSTAPVGTIEKIRNLIVENLADKNLTFDVASNPEFLKEGSAIEDFLTPDRIIIGTDTERAQQYFRDLYQHFYSQQKLISMDIISAELTKYAANAMLATRISFINEIANLADQLGADINHIRHGIGTDPRIGPYFIAPGCGYGGSCFPKDINAMIHTTKTQNLQPTLLAAVDKVNEQQKHILFQKISQHFKENLANRTFALWGLAFKPNTDDIREASSLVVLQDLWQAGAKINAYDPIAMDAIRNYFGECNNLRLCSNPQSCLDNADALIIVTEWQEFANFDLGIIKNSLRNPVIFDGRNIFDLTKLKNLGFTYYGIGRRI